MERETPVVAQETESTGAPHRADNLVLLAIAAAITLIHVFTNGRYGLHRDEWQTLSDALHMDWGFVAYPPFTPFVERISMAIFGHWLIGLRMASVIAQAVVIVVTGLMARELGGGRLAQATAALSVALAPLALFEGTEFQYTTFDYLWWVLIAYFVIRLLKSDDPRWCLAIGACVGIGLMTKYTMVFYAIGVVVGLVLTRARKFLRTGWFWAGIGLAFLICLPNAIWQVRHDFISYHFLHHIHVRDVGEGRADDFWSKQFWVNTDAVTLPLWIAGLIVYLRDSKYRMLAIMYLFPLVFFALTRARFYYFGAAYPMLLAMGAVAGERWIASMRRGWRLALAGIALAGIVIWGLLVSAILIPWASSGKLKAYALKNNGDLREEIGWEDLVREVARVRDGLPREQQANLGVLVGNYGEMGSIEIFGPQYQLPSPISLTNSGYLRSYPASKPSTLIVVGWDQEQVDEAFTGCRVAGHNGNSLGVKNEESKYHPDIYVCGGPKDGWPTFWKEHQRFG
jgi:4-amino-4-deoxy-L-arabinose transferase-like glycosyltransferase